MEGVLAARGRILRVVDGTLQEHRKTCQQKNTATPLYLAYAQPLLGMNVITPVGN